MMVTVSQDLETKAAKWYSLTIHVCYLRCVWLHLDYSHSKM